MPAAVLWHIARRPAAVALATLLPRQEPTSIAEGSPAWDSSDEAFAAFIEQLRLPDNFGWWIVVLIVNLLYIVPLCIFLSYSVNNLWPLLCIVESDTVTSYEPIALEDIGDDGAAKEATHLEANDDNDAQDDSANHRHSGQVTHSIRALNKMLYAIEGRRSLVHGLRPHMLLNFACAIISSLLSCIPMMPSMLAVAIAPLFTVQLYTGWVHIAISVPRSVPFYRRLPPFKSCFRATALPTLILWLSVSFSQQAPALVVSLMDVEMFDPTGLGIVELPAWTGSDENFIMLATMVVAYLLSTALLVIPAHMILTRIQASLLPTGEEPIVFLDRKLRRYSFDKEMPHGPTPDGLSMTDAFTSFTHLGWWRLTKMYAKMLLVTLAAEIFMASVLILQFMMLWNGSGYADESSETNTSGGSP